MTARPDTDLQAQDNAAMRALLTLPPISESASRGLAVPEEPPKREHTGDPEVDAVLWLREVIKTGNEALINKAMESAKLIKTPLKVLGDRYARLISQKTGSPMHGALASIGFEDLQSLAKSSIEKARRRHEALSRFGTDKALFAITAAGTLAKKALRGLKPKNMGFYDMMEVSPRMRVRPELAPATLDDCLYAQAYWDELYSLRNAFSIGDAWHEEQAHDDFAFAEMAHIQPRSGAEALRVLDYMIEHDYMDRTETEAILRNLIAGGRS